MHLLNKLSSTLATSLSISLLSFGISNANDLVYIQAGTLIDVQSGKLRKDQVITIRDDRILHVGDADDVNMEANATIIDLSGSYVMPGLIDMHDHLTGDHRYHGYEGLQFSVPREALFGVTNSHKELGSKLPSFIVTPTGGTSLHACPVPQHLCHSQIQSFRL